MRKLLQHFVRAFSQPSVGFLPCFEQETLLTETQLNKTLLFIHDRGFHELPRLASKLGGWVTVRQVVCPEPFIGYGYVRGRTRALRINRSMMLVEADEDYGFTDVCVLVNSIPTLMLRASSGGLSVKPLPGLSSEGSTLFYKEPFSTASQLSELPLSVRSILLEVINLFYKITPECALGNDALSKTSIEVNLGQRPFSYTPPTGFKPMIKSADHS